MKRTDKARNSYSSAFTIVELLVIAVIIGIIATIVLFVVNPGEIFKQTRDTNRLADLRAVDRALSSFQTDTGSPPGIANVIYISLPDSNSNCSSYTLPAAPAGWSYACRPSSSYRNIDGTGWIPFNLTTLSGAKLSQLPIDPVNTAQNRAYYAYFVSGNNWELNAGLESQNNMVGGSNDKTSTDGGDEPNRLEVGNNLVIAPWSLEFNAFPIVASNSGYPGWYGNVSTTVTIGSDGTSPNYARANGYAWYIWQENIPFNPDATYKMTCTARQITDPTVGGKGIFCGWTGVAANGVTLVNYSGGNGYSSQHYNTMSNNILTAGAGWVSYTGYTKGWSSGNGDSGRCPNASTPCKLHPNVRFIRPLFILNYSGGNGVADIDSITITKQ